MALHTRYNDDGTKILCDLKDISQLESNGYKHKENPIKYSAGDEFYGESKDEVVKKVTKEAVQPKSKTTRRNTRKSAQSNEKDIIL